MFPQSATGSSHGTALTPGPPPQPASSGAARRRF